MEGQPFQASSSQPMRGLRMALARASSHEEMDTNRDAALKSLVQVAPPSHAVAVTKVAERKWALA